MSSWPVEIPQSCEQTDRKGVTIKVGGELMVPAHSGKNWGINLTTTTVSKTTLLELSFKFLLLSKFKTTLICNWEKETLIENKSTFSWDWREDSEVELTDYSCKGPEFSFQHPGPTWCLTTICKPSIMGSDALFSLLWAPHAWNLHAYKTLRHLNTYRV